MEFTSPVKVPDGRYYLKISGHNRVQLNKIKVDSLVVKPVAFRVTDSQAHQLKALEDVVIAKAKELSVEWFGREVSEATIDRAFQSSMNGDTFETCLSTIRGEVATTFWDSERKPKDKDSDWDAGVDMIVELSGVWFLKKSFGPIFKILQVKENKPQRRVTEYLFSDDPVEEDHSDYLD